MKRIRGIVAVLSVIGLFMFGSISVLAGFNPRTTTPPSNDYRYFSNQNPYYDKWLGKNCTTYVYGRAWEILGNKPNISFTGNAGNWYNSNVAGKNYPYGSTPKLGAIACWRSPSSDFGHVAVVEAISGNTITMSEAWYGARVFNLMTKQLNGDIKIYDSPNFGIYYFQGFIYLNPEDSNFFDFWGFDDTNITGTKKIWWKEEGYGTCDVNLSINGTPIGTIYPDVGGYLSYEFNSENYENGDYNLEAIIRSTSGMEKKISRTIHIDNGFFMFWGFADIPLSGTNKIWWKEQSYGTCELELSIDGIHLDTFNPDSGGYFSYMFDSTVHSDGIHNMKAVIRNDSGREKTINRNIEIINNFTPISTVNYNGHTYSLFEELGTWEDDEKRCLSMGGYLATVTSEGEQRAIESLLVNTKRIGYFLGGYRENNSFAWVTGEKFEYSNWLESQPDNYKGVENYIEIYPGVNKWNDVSLDALGEFGRGFICEKVSDINVSNVTISQQNIFFNKKGATASITATVSPDNATNKSLAWKSSNTAVATVLNGKVTAISNGTAVITVTTQEGNKTASCTVTVNIPKPVVKVTGVTLNQKDTTLTTKGKTLKLNSQVIPSDAANKNVTWRSSNTSVASVDQKGTITAKKNGTAIITVTTADGNKTAVCKITVKIPAPVKVTAKSISLSKKSITLYKGKTYTLKAKVTPSNYKSGISWSSSNRNTTVSNSGKLTANKAGKSTITVRTNNNKTAICNVRVKEITSKRVTLNKRSITLYKGEKYSLKATVKPRNSTDSKKWSTSNKKYATVSNKGTITAVSKGKCNITVKMSNGMKSTCKVIVK